MKKSRGKKNSIRRWSEVILHSAVQTNVDPLFSTVDKAQQGCEKTLKVVVWFKTVRTVPTAQ